MQELIEWHRKSMRSYSETNKMIESLLEKEKEQHKETWFRSTAQFDNSAEITYKKLFEEHYNETYNQN